MRENERQGPLCPIETPRGFVNVEGDSDRRSHTAVASVHGRAFFLVCLNGGRKLSLNAAHVARIAHAARC